MTDNPNTAEEPPTPKREAPISIGPVDRRDALRFLGFGALGAVPLMTSAKIMDGLVRDIVKGSVSEIQAADTDGSREMGRIRQWTMIIDLAKCDGCQSQGTPPQCTLACIEGHFAPQPMEWIEVYEANTVHAVRKSALCEGVPRGRHLPHSRGNRPHRPGAVHRLPHMHGGMPVRPAILQLGYASHSSRSRPRRLQPGPSGPCNPRNGHEV